MRALVPLSSLGGDLKAWKDTHPRRKGFQKMGNSVTVQDPMSTSGDRPLSHILCFSSSLEYLDNSVWGTFPELFYRCKSQFSCSLLSDSLWPHWLQHSRPPCPSPTPGVYSNSCPSSRWCHPTISSSLFPFSSCPQSFPASGSFPTSQFFTSGGQSIGVSASASVLPMNIQDWSPLWWTGWISLQSKGLSTVFSNTTVQSINSLALCFLYSPTLTSIHDHWKNYSRD